MIQHHTQQMPFQETTRVLGFVWRIVMCLLVISPQSAGVLWAQIDFNSAEHPAEAKGYQQSSYDLSMYESINLANGNLTFRVPLHTLTTDGGLSYQLSLTHNAKQSNWAPWCREATGNDCTGTASAELAAGITSYGYTWDLRPPRIVLEWFYPNTYYDMDPGVPHWIDTSGAIHTLIGEPTFDHSGTPEPCTFTQEDPYCYTTANHRVTAEYSGGLKVGFVVESPDGTVYRHAWHVDPSTWEPDPGDPPLFADYEDYNFLTDVPGWYLTSIERGPWVGGVPQNRIDFSYCTGNLPESPCAGGQDNSWLLQGITASGESARSVFLNYESGTCCDQANPDPVCGTTLCSIDVPSFDPTLGGSTATSHGQIGFEFSSRTMNLGVFPPIPGHSVTETTPELTGISFPEGPRFEFDSVWNNFLDWVRLPSGAEIRYYILPGHYPLGVGNPSRWQGEPGSAHAQKTNVLSVFGCGNNNESPDSGGWNNTDGVAARTIEYTDSSGTARKETTAFSSFRNCARWGSTNLEDWPYDFSPFLKNPNDSDPNAYFKSYIWTVAETYDGPFIEETQPGDPFPVFNVEIHRFHPVTYDEFSVDYLETPGTTPKTRISGLAASAENRGTENFAAWTALTTIRRLRHVEIRKEAKYDLGDFFGDFRKADPTYEFQAARWVYTDKDGDPSDFCYEPVSSPDPTIPPSHDCMVFKETVTASDVDSYLNVKRNNVSTENAPVGTDVDRTYYSTFKFKDRATDPPPSWRGFNLVETTGVCDGADCDCSTATCTTSGHTWESVLDGTGTTGYYRSEMDFTNPTVYGVASFGCTSLTPGGCTKRRYSYDDDYGNRTGEEISGGYNVTANPDLFHSLVRKTTTVYRHGRPRKKSYEAMGKSLLLWEREIDPNTGLPRWHIGGDGAGFAYLFDGLGRITEIAPVQGSSDSGESTWSLNIQTYLDSNGNPQKLMGSTIEYILPNQSSLLTHNVYDSSNQTIGPPVGGILSVGTQGELRSGFHFDGRGRPTGWVESYIDTTGTLSHRSRASLDFFNASGRLQRDSEWVDGDDPSAAINWTDTIFDGVNRPVGVTAPDGSEVTTTYLGDFRSTISHWVAYNSSGTEWLFETTTDKDALGRVVKVSEQHDAANPTGDPVVSTYTYDQSDRLTDVIIHKSDGSAGQTRDFVYSTGGFLVESDEPERRMTFHAYDAAGNRLQERIEDGQDSVDRCMEHDDFGRIERKSIGACPSTSESAFFVYGDMPAGGYYMAGSSGYNKVVESTQHNVVAGGDAAVTHKWTYSGPGNRVSRRQTFIAGFGDPEDHFEVEYSHDAWGNVREVRHPSWSLEPAACGVEVSSDYHYDGISLSGSDLVINDNSIRRVGADHRYHPSGRLAKVNYYSGAGWNIGYTSEDPDLDGMARPLAIHGGWDSYGGGQPTTFWTEGSFAYDGSGNIKTIVSSTFEASGNPIETGTKTYVYDGLNRVREFHDGVDLIESYEYDRWGNITQLTRPGAGGFGLDFTQIYLDATNQAEEIYLSANPDNGYYLTWVRGNLINTPELPLLGLRSRAYTYSEDDRLMESLYNVGADYGTWRYAYDTAGERVASWHTFDGEVKDVELTIRDEAGVVLTDWLWTGTIGNATFERWKDYFYSGNRLIAQLTWSDGSPVIEYAFHDHLGSTRFTRRDGQNEKYLEYFPFGDFREKPDPLDIDHLFTGHERDHALLASGLDYMHARYYSPNLGRFMSVDPVGASIGSSQSWNRYSYVENNPVGFLDPDGRIKLRAELSGRISSKVPYTFNVVFEHRLQLFASTGDTVVGFAKKAVRKVGKWVNRGKNVEELVRSGWVDNHEATKKIEPIGGVWSKASFEAKVYDEFESLGGKPEGGVSSLGGLSGDYSAETLSKLGPAVGNVTKQMLLDGEISLSQRKAIMEAYDVEKLINAAIDASKDTNPGADAPPKDD